MTTTIRVGQEVAHFSNPRAIARVLAIREPVSGRYGVLSELRGAYMACPVLLLRWPSGRQDEDFAAYWSVARGERVNPSTQRDDR